MSEDSTAVQITWVGKLSAGIFLIAATVFAITTLFAYWPNKMPAPGKGDDAWYTNTRYEIILIEKDSCGAKATIEGVCRMIDSLKVTKDSLDIVIKVKMEAKDSAGVKKDSGELKKINETLTNIRAGKHVTAGVSSSTGNAGRIHLNTLLLILVSTMGFLGNMIHIAASFTSFVGNGTFKKSWILWYFVKPFTAAALALIVYFIIRAGFIGYGSDASSVSLYGVLCLAALAGLFTDNATLKLKEIFDVVFKPKDERGDKLDDFKIMISSIKPDKIDRAVPTKIIIEGKNFDKKKLVVKMNNVAVPGVVVTATKIEFIYTVAEADRDKTSFEMLITDEAGVVVKKNTFTV